jgi:hypothetical protein
VDDAIKLICSNCDALLGEIQVVAPDASLVGRVRAKCPFCGDFSWEKEVRGAFGFLGAARPNPADPKDEFPVTTGVGEEHDGDLTTIHQCKANKNARPIYA